MKAKNSSLELKYDNLNTIGCPCTFCKSNSHANNFQIINKQNIELVICEKCLNKAKEKKQ